MRRVRGELVGSANPLPSKAIFAKQKTKNAQKANDRHTIKAAKEINMQYMILLAVASVMILYVLIIAGCLCYVGRHGRRTHPRSCSMIERASRT
jgi:hypothetical protein